MSPFLCVHHIQWALGPTQSPVEWYWGLPSWTKWPITSLQSWGVKCLGFISALPYTFLWCSGTGINAWSSWNECIMEMPCIFSTCSVCNTALRIWIRCWMDGLCSQELSCIALTCPHFVPVTITVIWVVWCVWWKQQVPPKLLVPVYPTAWRFTPEDSSLQTELDTFSQ
jgi:hypothetical protein